ncbi:MAG: aa3-type cytochrome c oxidase subunit IV [Alphaproteobacteria bacterium]|nr:aa3-type cytochrome c oxidase subunit IV [Alphaproteobacteria bacterium]
MSSHAPQPTEQQLQPLVENNRTYWSNFTKATTFGVIAVFVLVGLMALFLVKH